MRLSATVATALFASMFGNSANATRPNTAGTKANRAMIIPQMMEPRTAVFSSFAAKYRCTDSWPVEKVMKYMIIRPMMVFQPTLVKPSCSGGNFATTDSQPPTLCNTNGTAREKPPTRTKKMDNVRHRYAPHAAGHGVNYENRAADEDGELLLKAR